MSIVVRRLFSMVMGQIFWDGFSFWIVSSWKGNGREMEMVVEIAGGGGGGVVKRLVWPNLGVLLEEVVA